MSLWSKPVWSDVSRDEPECLTFCSRTSPVSMTYPKTLGFILYYIYYCLITRLPFSQFIYAQIKQFFFLILVNCLMTRLDGCATCPNALNTYDSENSMTAFQMDSILSSFLSFVFIYLHLRLCFL